MFDLFNKKKLKKLEEENLLLKLKCNLRKPTLDDITTETHFLVTEDMKPRYLIQLNEEFSILLDKDNMIMPAGFYNFLKARGIDSSFVSKEIIFDYMSDRDYCVINKE